MLCSSSDLKVYKEYLENVLNGNIISYDEELIKELDSHKNKEDKSMKSFLKTIQNYHGCSIYLKARYLKQFLSDEFVVCDGFLTCFENKQDHSWIESEDKVYDLLLVGVWPKDLYYKIMKPVVEKKIDINKDEEYKRITDKTIEIESNEDEFGYYDWYSYMKNNTINTRGLIEPLRLKKFK